MTANCLRKKDTRRGFTLTELAIVLGVIGVILAAIWVASAQVKDKNRAQQASTQIIQIVTAYRTLFAQHAVDYTLTAPADWYDITCTGINAGFFPAGMVQPGTTCSAAAAETSGTPTIFPLAPWGGASYAQVWAHPQSQGIIVAYGNLPQTACNELAMITFNEDNVIFENVNNALLVVPPMTTDAINTACAAGNANIVFINYKAR